MSHRALVYTELQISVPFRDAPWQQINKALLTQPGFRNKTWLAGVATNSVGGIYEFDTIENAQTFVTGYFPTEAKRFGVAQTSRIFNLSVVEEASRYLNSVHFGHTLTRKPGAFVYTEGQIGAPFDAAPWRTMNPVLKSQPGLLSKTWLSGHQNNSVGGIYAFDTLEHATRFVTDYFPTEAKGLNIAYTTRLFDASVVESASREVRSLHFH